MNEFAHVTCTVMDQGTPRKLSVSASRLICFGYSGRDISEVNHHIEQLEPLGIPAPKQVPLIMEVAPWLLTDSERFSVQGFRTSGEVEFVMVHSPETGAWHVGVGSDHGDLELEKFDGAMAKQMGPKVLSRELWNYDEVKDHWDTLQMRSWVTVDGKRRLHQSASVSVMLHPDSLMQLIAERMKADTGGMVIYSGTITCLGPLVFPTGFEAELFDPVMNRRLSLAYTVEAFNRTH